MIKIVDDVNTNNSVAEILGTFGGHPGFYTFIDE